jgi:cell division protein FtsL
MTDLTLITEDTIKEKIYIIRSQKVMLDHDLAELYEQLKRQVRRNPERFPQNDFMFELTKEEFSQISRSQNGTLKHGTNIKYAPMAFTELGIAMISSVLNSSRAIQVNIQIIRIFTRIRQLVMDNAELRLEIEEIKNRLDSQDKNFEAVFLYLDELSNRIPLIPEPAQRKHIGFKRYDE